MGLEKPSRLIERFPRHDGDMKRSIFGAPIVAQFMNLVGRGAFDCGSDAGGIRGGIKAAGRDLGEQNLAIREHDLDRRAAVAGGLGDFGAHGRKRRIEGCAVERRLRYDLGRFHAAPAHAVERDGLVVEMQGETVGHGLICGRPGGPTIRCGFDCVSGISGFVAMGSERRVDAGPRRRKNECRRRTLAVQNWIRGRASAFALAIASIAVLLGAERALWAQESASAGTTGRIVVEAEGRAEAAPDMAVLRLGVVAEAEEAETASADMAAAAEAVLGEIAAAGVEPRDLQTSALRVTPQFRRYETARDGPPEIVGYVADTTVTVHVRELDALGAVIDAALTSGANRFDGLSFGLSDPQTAEDAARRAAVAAASRRATLLAEAAGVALGRLELLEDVSRGGPAPMMRAEMSLADAGTGIATGEIDIVARVRMTYAIAAQ